MEQAKGIALQERLRNEALAMLALIECESCAAEYQQAIQLVGKACGIPHATTEEHLRMIDIARMRCEGKLRARKLNSQSFQRRSSPTGCRWTSTKQ